MPRQPRGTAGLPVKGASRRYATAVPAAPDGEPLRPRRPAVAGRRRACRSWRRRIMQKPWLLDLFAGESAAGEGYRRAGWNVLGIEIDFNRAKHNPGQLLDELHHQ